MAKNKSLVDEGLNFSPYRWDVIAKLKVALDVEVLFERLGELTVEWVVCDMLLKGFTKEEICRELSLTDERYEEGVERIRKTSVDIGLE